jgi:N-acetylmuramoyl-L-alanine amidase
MRIVISSGHGLKIRGASCDEPWGLDEVDEARRVVPAVAENLRKLGHEVVEFNDDVSTSQNENLHRIVDFHNAQSRDLDVSVHFNAYVPTDVGRGTEVLFVSQEDLAQRVVDAISNASGLINRGPKKRTDLYFLNNTNEPAILIETCFVDSKCDADLYRKYFDAICRAIAMVGNKGRPQFYEWEGLVSWFGGPEDDGVDPDEGLAFIYEVEDQPDLFLDEQPPGTTGLARRLDPDTHYIAMRWDYSKSPREMLLDKWALVKAPKTGRKYYARPGDWGPHIDTGRIADISPGLMEKLGITTDDEVVVSFPHDPQKEK